MPLLRSVRLWFSLAVAVIAAAVGDPLLEAASNAGWFGPGNFTDHSNIDVVPALLIGLAAIAVHLVFRTRAASCKHASDVRESLRRWDAQLRENALILLPFTFAAQIFTLFSMETIEQIITTGHPFGGLIWMGAPPAISLLVHAAVALALFFAATHVMHRIAWAAIRAVKLLCAPLRRHASHAVVHAIAQQTPHVRLSPVLCTIGGRAPPSYAR